MRRYLLPIICLAFLLPACDKDSSGTTAEDTANWMHNILAANPDKNIALTDICIPGSHDAGTYVFTSCTFGANTCNTRTQYLDTRAQLYAGIRMFDIRPVFFNNRFFTQHATSCDGLGCKGDALSSMFASIRDFLDTHNELVILEISHYCHTAYDDTAFLNLVYSSLGERIYKETETITTPFINRPLKEIIPPDAGSGKVILLLEAVADNPENKAAGLFSGNLIPRSGSWTDSHKFSDLKQKQLENYTNFTADGNSLFSFSWQITQDNGMAVSCFLSPDAPSIEKLALDANQKFGPIVDSLIGANAIRKGRIPNIVYSDFCDSKMSKICLQINKVSLQ